MLSTLFGLGALKAHFGGAAPGVVALGSILAGACDLNTLGQWLLRIGIGVVGFAGWVIGVYTWMTGRPPP